MQREQQEDVTRENMSNKNIKPRKSTTATNSEAQRCPRCDSANTKFCYYNNYSLTQPRYYCKSCRRYWTHGGTLRNVPVGGGSRKGKRPKTAAISPASAAAASDPLNPVSSPATSFQLPGSVLENSQFSYLPAFAQPPQTTFAQALLPPEFHSGSSAMSLLQGFGDGSSSNASFGAIQHGQQFFVNPHFPSGTSSEMTMWNMGVTNNNTGSSGSALAPNQWPDLSGSYGSPPP